MQPLNVTGASLYWLDLFHMPSRRSFLKQTTRAKVHTLGFCSAASPKQTARFYSLRCWILFPPICVLLSAKLRDRFSGQDGMSDSQGCRTRDLPHTGPGLRWRRQRVSALNSVLVACFQFLVQREEVLANVNRDQHGRCCGRERIYAHCCMFQFGVSRRTNPFFCPSFIHSH